MDTRKKKDILIIVMVVALVFMSTAYALLSQQLNINGTATISDSWNVKITSIEELASSGTAEAGSASGRSGFLKIIFMRAFGSVLPSSTTA